MPLRLLVLFFLLITPAIARAEPMHAIAMHGDPKYGAGFTHFEYTNPDAPTGGRLVMSRTGTFNSLNPFILRGNPADGRSLVFESLMARSDDEPFTLYGLIAESIEVPKDRSWVIFRLNPGARFQDGQPVTVDDVIFSLKTLRDHGRPNHHAYYSQVTGIERVGQRGVRFRLGDGGDRELPLILGLMPVLPKHWFKDRAFDRVSLDRIPASGPYKVARVEPGRSIVYQRDPNYWGRNLAVNAGRYNFDEVRYEYFRDDDLALEAFRAGTIDFRQETSPRKWAVAYEGEALRQGRIVKRVLPNGRPAGMNALVFNTRRPLFEDRQVRKALIEAFNFEWMNRKLFYDAYTRTQSFFENSELEAPLTPGADERALAKDLGAARHPALATALAPMPRSTQSGRENLKNAKQILDSLGFSVREGQLVSPAGKPVSFEILLNDPANMRVAQQYARDLERLGIVAEARLVDESQYQERLNTYDFDMIIYFWGQSLSPGNEQAFYWGGGTADRPGTRNYMGVRDPLVDKLVSRITGAATRDELITATRLLDRVLRAGLYVLPLYYLDGDRVAYWNRIAMPEVTPLMGYSPETWWATGR
jgi:ABC-type oligopeptide transport system substrate-binding subunit